jgi:polar amino acid transport system substrate-binding protein
LVLAFTFGIGAQTTVAQQTQDPRVADLVQAGVLRVGLGLGILMSAIKDPATGKVRGAALEMALALATRMGVKLEIVEYPRPGAVIDGLRTNAWDVSCLVMDPERAQQVEFSHPYLQSDFTYMVPAGSKITSVTDVDQSGIRIAVPRGDGSELYLTRTLRHAELIRTDTHAAALELLRTGGADARAAPRSVLMPDSSKLAGSRVLDDGFAVIYFAALVPKGHAARLSYINEFIDDAKASGLITRVISSVGLQGVRVAPAEKSGPRG